MFNHLKLVTSTFAQNRRSFLITTEKLVVWNIYSLLVGFLKNHVLPKIWSCFSHLSHDFFHSLYHIILGFSVINNVYNENSGAILYRNGNCISQWPGGEVVIQQLRDWQAESFLGRHFHTVRERALRRGAAHTGGTCPCTPTYRVPSMSNVTTKPTPTL